jgi:superfamily II DNA or RNA helicase
MSSELTPGTLVHLRGREWVVLERVGAAINVRPLGGLDVDTETVLPHLESDLRPASFEWPTATQLGPSAEARLLRDSLSLVLRRGAGPFRSFGRLSFEPRAYQLVPLLMALKQETVRLLIADDVGIGKTIEAGLIARELLDRGEISRLAVLCPPHLVDQWVQELVSKFGIEATAVTAASAPRLERNLRSSLFEDHPFVVASLDYFKSERRRFEFASACPDFVIVDEAHTCVGTGAGGRQQRFDLLRRLGQRQNRHLVLLSATPHSGDSDAFARLVGLLDESFGALEHLTGSARDKLREKLSDHFVQRRRADIDAWNEPGLFPVPETNEKTYRLTAESEAFYEAVLDYCADVTEKAGEDDRRRRLAFWGTLALMRCVASSPVAALQALRTRARRLDELSQSDEELLRSQAFDGEDELSAEDGEPAPIDDQALEELVKRAEALAADPRRDEKLKTAIKQVKALVADGFSPVVFCRYIATAHGVGAALAAAVPNATVDVVTGELPPDERKTRVENLGGADCRVLVATDCLSEGINLQDSFDAVVHYDLSWNPTRHQQREGRVNRFGQQSSTVRSLLIYGENNPVDGAVLKVILRKAEKIRRDTGVPVPLPDNERAMTEALLQAVLLQRRKKERSAPLLPFEDLPEAKKIERAWEDASRREKETRTVFAQRALKPDTVIPEWKKAQASLGGGADTTRRFLTGALARFGAPLIQEGERTRLRIPPDPAHRTLRERLEVRGVPATMRIVFNRSERGELVHRTHPLVATLGEALVERTLDRHADQRDPATLGRAAVWATKAVSQVTTVALLRLRLQIKSGDNLSLQLAEEVGAVAWEGLEPKGIAAAGEVALALLDAVAEADLADGTRQSRVLRASSLLEARCVDLETYAHARAEALQVDHERVRVATMRDRRTTIARVQVEPVLPVDVVGLYVLLPEAE